jgi:hypothetical protein
MSGCHQLSAACAILNLFGSYLPRYVAQQWQRVLDWRGLVVATEIRVFGKDAGAHFFLPVKY